MTEILQIQEQEYKVSEEIFAKEKENIIRQRDSKLANQASTNSVSYSNEGNRSSSLFSIFPIFTDSILPDKQQPLKLKKKKKRKPRLR